VSYGSASHAKGVAPKPRSGEGGRHPNNVIIGSLVASFAGMERRFVYTLQSLRDSNKHYVGLTCDPQKRLEWHNAGRCSHTAKWGPWKLSVSIEFSDERHATAFERYLKSGSGRAFAKRHFD